MNKAVPTTLPESLYRRKKDVPCTFATKVPRRRAEASMVVPPHPFAALAEKHNKSTREGEQRRGGGGESDDAADAAAMHTQHPASSSLAMDCTLESELRRGSIAGVGDGGAARRGTHATHKGNNVPSGHRPCLYHAGTQTCATLATVALRSEECQTDLSGDDASFRSGGGHTRPADWGSPKARPRGTAPPTLSVSDAVASSGGGNESEHSLMSNMHHDHAAQRERIMAGDLAVREAKLMLMVQKQQVEHERDIAKERETSAAMEELATRHADMLRTERLQHEVALNDMRVAVEVARNGTEDLQRILAATQEEVAHLKRTIAEHEEASVRASKDQSRRIVEAMEKHLVRQHDESEQRNATRIAEEQRRYKERREEWLRTVRQQPVPTHGGPPGDAIHNSQSSHPPPSPSVGGFGGMRSPSATSSTASADRSPRQALLRTSEWMSDEPRQISPAWSSRTPGRNSVVGSSSPSGAARRGSTAAPPASATSTRSKERRGSVATLSKTVGHTTAIRRVSQRHGAAARLAGEVAPMGAAVEASPNTTKFAHIMSPTPLQLSALTTPPRDEALRHNSLSSEDAATGSSSQPVVVLPPQAASSLRAQMSTAFAETSLGSDMASDSAGHKPTGTVHPPRHSLTEPPHRTSRMVSFDGATDASMTASDSHSRAVDALMDEGDDHPTGRRPRTKSMFSSEALSVMKTDMHDNTGIANDDDGGGNEGPSSNRKMLHQRKEHATRQLESALIDVERLTKLLKERSAADTMIDAEMRLQACADALKVHYDEQHKHALEKVKQREREVAELFTVKVAALEGELQSMSNMVHGLHDKVEGLEAQNEALVLRAERAERTHAAQTGELGRLHATLLAVDQDTMCCLCRENVLRDEVDRFYRHAQPQHHGVAAATSTPRRPTSAAPSIRGAMQVRPSPLQPRSTPQQRRSVPPSGHTAGTQPNRKDGADSSGEGALPREAMHPSVVGAIGGDGVGTCTPPPAEHGPTTQAPHRPPQRGSAMDISSSHPPGPGPHRASLHRSSSILQEALDSAVSPFATGLHERVQAVQRANGTPTLGLGVSTPL